MPLFKHQRSKVDTLHFRPSPFVIFDPFPTDPSLEASGSEEARSELEVPPATGRKSAKSTA